MTNDFYVYVHRRADDNLPFYVGKGRKQRAWNFYSRNAYWNNTEKKHGVIVELVFENLTEEEAFQCEVDTILEFKYFDYPLTNLTVGGDGVSGYKQTPEQIEKAKASRANSDRWKAGHKASSEKLRGRKLSEAHRSAISKGNTGNKLSEETKRKQSASKKNCQKAMDHILSIVEDQRDKTIYDFYCITGETFSGTRKEFAEHTGIAPKNINKLFQQKNTRKSTHNWALSQIQIKVPKKEKPISKPCSSGKVNLSSYTFYHVLGDVFVGTRAEFSDYSQIGCSQIAALFCKNPRRTVYGWSLKKIDTSTYTHLKT